MNWLSIPNPVELKSFRCRCGKSNFVCFVDSDDACHVQVECNHCGRVDDQYVSNPVDIPTPKKSNKSRFVQPDRYRKMSSNVFLRAASSQEIERKFSAVLKPYGLTNHEIGKVLENLVFFDTKIGVDEVLDATADYMSKPPSDADLKKLCTIFAEWKKASREEANSSYKGVAKYTHILDGIAEDLEACGAYELSAAVDELSYALITAATSDSPDAYRKEHGKCPSGYQFDGKKCVKSGGSKSKSSDKSSIPSKIKTFLFKSGPKAKQSSNTAKIILKELLISGQEGLAQLVSDAARALGLDAVSYLSYMLLRPKEMSPSEQWMMDKIRGVKSKKVASAIAAFQVTADDADPDKYRQEHGKCPEGYHFNEATQKCEKTDTPKEESKPEEAPKPEETPAEEPKTDTPPESPVEQKPEEPAQEAPEPKDEPKPEGSPVETPVEESPPTEDPKSEDAPKEKKTRKKRQPVPPEVEEAFVPPPTESIKPVPVEKKKGFLSKIGDAFQKADEKLGAAMDKIKSAISGSGDGTSWIKNAANDTLNTLGDSALGLVGTSIAVTMGLNPIAAFGLALYFMHKRAETRYRNGQTSSADMDITQKDLEDGFKDILNADPDDIETILYDIKSSEDK